MGQLLNASDLNLKDTQTALYTHDWAKAYFVLLDEDMDIKEDHAKKCEIGEEIENIFEHSHSYKLQAYSLLLLCKLYQKEAIRSLEYGEKGLKLCKDTGLDALEQYFKQAIEAANHEIRYKYENKFIFLSAAPLTMPEPLKQRKEDHYEFDEPAEHDFEEDDGSDAPPPMKLSKKRSMSMGSQALSPLISPIAHNDRLTSHLSTAPSRTIAIRKDLYLNHENTLIKSGKKLSVIYDCLTKDIFSSLYSKNEGCKLLVVDFEYTEEGSLIIDDGSLGGYRITKEMMQKYNSRPDKTLNADVMIIMNNNGSSIMKMFKESNIKLIIYFEFPGAESLDELDFITIYWLEELKKMFVNRFIEEFTTNRSATKAVEFAKKETIESINAEISKRTELYRGVFNSYVQESDLIIKKLSVSLSLDNIRVEEGKGASSIYCRLVSGELEDATSCNWKRYAAKEYTIRREREVKNIYEILKRDRQINVYGQGGVGKSEIVRNLAREVSIRKQYEDGIFYFELNSISSSESIRRVVTNEVGESVGTIDYFKKRNKMLMIFDNYELVLEKSINEPTFLLDDMRSAGIHIIFITTTKDSKPFSIDGVSDYKIEPLNMKQSLIFLLSLNAMNGKFFTFDQESFERLQKCDTLKECGGIPRELINRAKRFFKRELGAIYNYPDKSLLCKGQSLHSPSGDPRETSSRDFLSDDKSIDLPTLNNASSIQYQSKLTTNLSMNIMNPSKSHHHKDSKKDSKDSKLKRKNKNKKNMN